MSQALTMTEFLDWIPSNEQCREAMQRAEDEHYEEDWIDDVDEIDLRDSYRQLWRIAIGYRDESGEPSTPATRDMEMRETMKKLADALCRRYADENWSDYLER